MTSVRGAVALTMALLAGVVAVVGVGSASIGLLYTARERATTAAEAAALAAAVATYPAAASSSPLSAAAALARDNGASLDACWCRVDRSLGVRNVIVLTSLTVRVPLFGEVKVAARAAAEFDPLAWLGP